MLGSQEGGSLPLSQESYLALYRTLSGIPLDTIMNEASNIPLNGEDNCILDGEKNTSALANSPFMEQHNHENTSGQTIPISCLSLPASNNWPGDYEFKVSFSPQTNTKGVSWIYSQERNKLYIGKDVPCPVRFSTSTYMGNDVIIRAMALFSTSDHAAEIVTRCVNHSLEDLQKNVFEATHFIRCDSRNAVYEENDITKRHSVIIPYENPSVGSNYTTYLFKFKCFGSCSGGPNRRPLMVVFTLERNNCVLGRQTIDLKVCACPARDYKTDEKQGVVKENKPPLKRPTPGFFPESEKKIKLEEDYGTCFTTLNLAKSEKMNKLGDDGCFNIKVPDRDAYIFLKKMRKLYYLHKHMKENCPDFFSSSSSSGE